MDETSNFCERLKRWRAKLELIQPDAAKVLGIGRAYYSELENNREPGKFLRQKFETLEFASASEVRAILNDRVSVFGQQKAEEPAGHYGTQMRRVPVIGWAQAMDATSLVDFNDTVNWENFAPSDIRDPKAIAVTIRGDSMEPEYREGDIAILSCSLEPRSGNLIVGRLRKEGPVFKRLQVLRVEPALFRLISFNQLYAPIERNREDFYWLYPVHSVIKKLM